jgi:hypothetical protein
MAFSWRNLFQPIVAHRAECLTVLAWLTGWILLTAAIDRRSVWLASMGLLALGAGGWRPLWAVVTHGLYTLTRGDDK